MNRKLNFHKIALHVENNLKMKIDADFAPIGWRVGGKAVYRN